MWRARFAASEPPEAPGSHSRQRSRAPPAGHWARNKTHNRESLGDTVQDGGRGEGRELRGEGWDAIIWGKILSLYTVM